MVLTCIATALPAVAGFPTAAQTQATLCAVTFSCKTTTAVAATAVVGPDCGGVPTEPKAGGGQWTCTFDDEFSGATLDRTKWLPAQTATTGFSSNRQDCYVDSPDNVSVGGGVLQLTSRLEPAPFTCVHTAKDTWTTQVTSGSVSTYGLFSQTYGRFEVRARVLGAKVPGVMESFWMWPQSYKYPLLPWPANGEIDIAEIFHRYPDRAIPYLHQLNGLDPNATNNSCMIDDIGQFHTYVAEWTSASIKIIYDGVTCLEDKWTAVLPETGRDPFDVPFIIALTQALGQKGNEYVPGTTPLPASTQVDYVRIYK
jgi:beta-glucanase (GH16 family)